MQKFNSKYAKFKYDINEAADTSELFLHIVASCPTLSTSITESDNEVVIAKEPDVVVDKIIHFKSSMPWEEFVSFLRKIMPFVDAAYENNYYFRITLKAAIDELFDKGWVKS